VTYFTNYWTVLGITYAVEATLLALAFVIWRAKSP
jgi:hypothetical protein